MNTPAHVILNSLVLGRGEENKQWVPVTAGALLPDLPMFGFFFYERYVLGTPSRVIWNESYFETGWQAFFDLFNSLPLIAVGLLIAWRLKQQAAVVFLLSMALHCLADLPLHNDDAHAHFYPLTNWHFESPVSYWDPDHFGGWFAVAELLLVLVGSVVLVRRKSSVAWRVIGVGTLVLYALGASIALVMWSVA